MFGLITKFLPSLIPGLGALANPWVWLILLSSLTGSFLYGVYLEHGRFEAHLEQDKAVQQAYDFWAKQRNQGQQRINQETVNDLKSRNTRLASDNAVLLGSLHKLANTTSLPTSPLAGGGDSGRNICFERAGLDAGDRAIRQARGEFLAAIADRYGRARSVVQACLEWDAKQRQLELDTPPPSQ